MAKPHSVQPVSRKGPTANELKKARALAKKVSPKLYRLMEARTRKTPEE